MPSLDVETGRGVEPSAGYGALVSRGRAEKVANCEAGARTTGPHPSARPKAAVHRAVRALVGPNDTDEEATAALGHYPLLRAAPSRTSPVAAPTTAPVAVAAPVSNMAQSFQCHAPVPYRLSGWHAAGPSKVAHATRTAGLCPHSSDE